MFPLPSDSVKQHAHGSSNTTFKQRMADPACRWPAVHPRLTLLLVVLAVLAPFLAKPFNIDDPLFLWTARQIQAHPADPYGFHGQLVWNGGADVVGDAKPAAGQLLPRAGGGSFWLE